jgi:hypothetical protein
MKAILAIASAAVAAAALGACAGEPLIISDQSEINAHRLSGPPIIRGVNQCVHETFRHEDVGYGANTDITLRVDSRGRASFVGIEDPEPPLLDEITARCRQQIEQALADWRYRPFERDGRIHAAEIVEQILMLPAERWRTADRPFPPIQDMENVTITLQRQGGLAGCREERSVSYVLQIRGNGEVTIWEAMINPNRGPRQPIEIHGPPRRYMIDRAKVEALIGRFQAARFFSLEAAYNAGITDQPGQKLFLDTGTERAVVEDYVGEVVGMPFIVRDLQVAVDSAAGLPPLSPQCGPERTLRRR